MGGISVALDPRVTSSSQAPAQRWRKLYRKIHDLFLQDEFVHIDDYKLMVRQMNDRISIIETKINTELQKIAQGVSAHTHPSPPAPVNPVVTAPPAVPPYTPGFEPTKEVQLTDKAMKAENRKLQAEGPALSPLGGGQSKESLLASREAASNVGA